MTYTILNDVLVQLDKLEPQEGLYLPKFDTFASEDGRQRTRISDNVYSTKGTVLQSTIPDINPGDRVIITSPNAHKFFFNVSDSTHFTGLIKVPLTLIDAKINQD